MDLSRELTEESKESYLGANVPGFMDWIRDNIGIEIDFPTDEIIDYLREIHWEAYINDLEYADKAKFKMVSY